VKNIFIVNKPLNNLTKTLKIEGDKSLSIRWVLFSSLASGISKANNLLLSEDVFAAINAIKKLGIKVNFRNNKCLIHGRGIDGYKYKKNITIDAKNSGTLGRLILGLLINTPYPIKIIGDQSLSKRDFNRVAFPLSKFGSKFELNKNHGLPLKIFGTKKSNPIKYFEKKGSAQ